MKHSCEKCGAQPAFSFSRLELESWDMDQAFPEKKDFYYLCQPCFDKLANMLIPADEIKERKKFNRDQLEKAIEEGIVCPKCKTVFIEDEEHICPV